MARKIEDIVLELEATKAEKAELAGLNSTSKTAIWRLIFYVVAVSIWTLENLFDIHLAEVEAKLLLLKPHSASWYKEKILQFRYGHTLTNGEYSDVGYTAEQIAAAKIIKQAVVIDNNTGDVYVKVAKALSTSLQKLSNAEVAALNSYLMKVKDAGVSLLVSSLDADNLKVTMTVYVDPSYITIDGFKVGSTIKVIEEAAVNYLLSLPFNSEFTRMGLVDAIQKIEGVRIVELTNVQAKKASEVTFINVPVLYVSSAGYMKFNTDDLTINYIAYV